MKTNPWTVVSLISMLAAVGLPLAKGAAAPAAPAAAANAQPSTGGPVTVTDDGRFWTLSNGIVSAKINKRNGDLEGLEYKGLDRLGHDQGRVGCWEQDPSAAAQVNGLTQSLTIDPAKNGGERAEVSIKGVTGGTVGLTPGSPGAPATGTFNLDLEIRYTMGRGDSGVYTYAIFSHPAEYGALNVPESRFITRVSQRFDWISVDADRNMLAAGPLNWGTGVVVHAKEQRIMSQGPFQNSVEHKYSYNAIQYKVPAFGWSSTQDHMGIWFINPTIEFLSGGATKQELLCHYGDNDNPDPIILDYWRGTHYGGGASATVAAGETWSKVVGPIMIYANSLSDPETPSAADMERFAATAGNPEVPAAWTNNATRLWKNALAQAKAENAKWPYDWVNGVDYPHKNERGNVTGQIVLSDLLAPNPGATKLPNLTIGLADPSLGNAGGGGGGFAGGGRRDWAHDAKFYQFWNDGTEDGKFTITMARPGNYTLHAIADGVLGEFAQANVTVEAGKSVDLGKLTWTPVRYGKQVWEIGYPNRNSSEFFKGDGANYWLWGWPLRYSLLFPDDLSYTVGKSDFHKDWFFEQVPHATSTAWLNPDAKDPANQRFGWVKAESREAYPRTDTDAGLWRTYGNGRATTWTINFDMNKAGQGVAVLRFALAGADGGGLTATLNGQSIGAIRPTSTNALRYNTDKGLWQEQTITFDGALLKPGENVLQLTVPAGEVTSGVVYDYLRLELNEANKVDGTPVASTGP